jgi:hypothetical protein
VTQTGAPIRTAAPVLPPTATHGTLPAVQSTATGPAAKVGGAAAVTGGQAQHVDSAHFAHPNSSVNSNTSTGTPKATTGVGTNASTGKSTLQTEQQIKGNGQPEYRKSTQHNDPHTTNTTTTGTPQTYTPTNKVQPTVHTTPAQSGVQPNVVHTPPPPPPPPPKTNNNKNDKNDKNDKNKDDDKKHGG